MAASSAEASRWLAQAEADLDTAGRLRDIDIHYAACFFAQQAAEKAVKAVIYAQGASRVIGHSVADLCRAAAARQAEMGALAAELAPLDLYYIPTRYPNGLAGGIAPEVFTTEDSARALRLATRALEAARRWVPAGPPFPAP